MGDWLMEYLLALYRNYPEPPVFDFATDAITVKFVDTGISSNEVSWSSYTTGVCRRAHVDEMPLVSEGLDRLEGHANG